MRVRSKICGLTRLQDVQAAVEHGADALGLVFYPPSRRHLRSDEAATLARAVPAFVTVTGLFVNAEAAAVREVLAQVPLNLLQFHGDEEPDYCRQFGLPYIKAVRVQPGLDLLQYASAYPDARGLLLDAFVAGVPGGTGHSFDWSLIPPQLPLPLILSGGLDPGTVSEAVRRTRPFAVDVSSGVESSPGIKDAGKIAAFIKGVRDAELSAA